MDTEVESEVSSNLTIRGLPTDVRRTLAARAKSRRISLNALVVELLTREAETPTMGEWLAELDRVRLPTGLSGDDVVDAVREVREEREAKWA